MNRKLATIQRIKQLLPISGADRIEVAVINGWQVVTQKGQHKEGDLVVFYEIDSFLSASDPRYASFEDRFTNWGDKRGMRLKTVKLRKTLSQGLIMPVRSFPEITDDPSWQTHERVGLDVTDILKIEKWEAAEPNGNASATAAKTRAFPYFLRKTDQERIQNYGHLVAQNLDTKFEVTVKKDGSSMTVFRVDPSSPYYADAVGLTRGKQNWFQRLIHWGADLVNGKEAVFGICSRNVLLPLEGNSNFHKAAKDVLATLGSRAFNGYSYAIQGEVVAPDIQGNYEKVTDVEFHVFDIFNIDQQKYFLPEERRTTALVFGLRHVKVVDKGTLRDILRIQDGEDVVQKALTYATGEGDNEGVMREGVVMKAEDRDFSFKAISNEYLLHKQD